MGHHRFSLIAACAAAVFTAAAAQEPQSAPRTNDADAARPERRNVSDAQLGLEVQVHLFQELNVSNISSIVRFGVATLDGVVAGEDERRRAEQIALTVPGVNSVINDLRIADASIVAITSEAEGRAEREAVDIETAVAERINSDPTLGSRSIVVVADEQANTVTLTGTVSTQDEKDRASALAVRAFPAGQVRNQLEIRQRL